MELNRRDTILKLIVEYFIKNAQPVGSQTLIQEYGLEYSSATIRNEMQALEELGYLEKTHTSSGRVPSSFGYKYYIENLRHKDLDEEIKYSLQNILQEKNKSIDDVLKESCEILSHMTNLVSVVMGPDGSKESIAKIELIPLNSSTAIVIFITNNGYVEHKNIAIPSESRMEEIQDCIKIINKRICGTQLDQMEQVLQGIQLVLSEHIKNYEMVYNAFANTFLKFAQERVSS